MLRYQEIYLLLLLPLQIGCHKQAGPFLYCELLDNSEEYAVDIYFPSLQYEENIFVVAAIANWM